VKCAKDADCPENEFCDPYKECQCKRSEDFVVRYKGKCIHGLDGNDIFCNGNSFAFSVRHEIPRKGDIAYTEKIEDLNCMCNRGHYGLNCERLHSDYPDKMPVADEYYLPEPNCKKDEECDEGMKCGETGYCYCDGTVVFDDPVLHKAVTEAVGKSDFTGEDLVNVTKMNLIQIQRLNNMKCLPNLRAMEISQPYETLEITEIAKCKNLQYLHMTEYDSAAFDFTPLLELKKLLFLGLELSRYNYKFLEKMSSENHIESINFDFIKGDYPQNLDFLKNFKRLRIVVISFGQNATLNNKCPVDLSVFSQNSGISHLTLYPGSCEIKGLEHLVDLKDLRNLQIGALTNDEKQARQLKLSDFPVLPNVTTLWIDSTIFDGKLVDHFPSLTSLHVYGYGIEMKDLEYLNGMSNLKLLYISENYINKVPFDDKRYDPIGKMPNLTELDIRNMSSRNYLWISGLKHIALAGFPNENRYDEYVQDYNENGSGGTEYYSNLLYLSTYVDNTYHIDNAEGFRENCDKNGAFCNSSFWNNYMNENDYFPPTIGLCSNPLLKDDEDVQHLLDKGVGINIGIDTNSCKILGNENNNYPRFLMKTRNSAKTKIFQIDETDEFSQKWITK